MRVTERAYSISYSRNLHMGGCAVRNGTFELLCRTRWTQRNCWCLTAGVMKLETALEEENFLMCGLTLVRPLLT